VVGACIPYLSLAAGALTLLDTNLASNC